MAEFDSGEPTIEVRVQGDWSQFDEEERRRQREPMRRTMFTSESQSPSFGNEGRQIAGASSPREMDISRQVQAADRMAAAAERQAAAADRIASTVAPGAGATRGTISSTLQGSISGSTGFQSFSPENAAQMSPAERISFIKERHAAIQARRVETLDSDPENYPLARRSRRMGNYGSSESSGESIPLGGPSQERGLVRRSSVEGEEVSSDPHGEGYDEIVEGEEIPRDPRWQSGWRGSHRTQWDEFNRRGQLSGPNGESGGEPPISRVDIPGDPGDAFANIGPGGFRQLPPPEGPPNWTDQGGEQFGPPRRPAGGQGVGLLGRFLLLEAVRSTFREADLYRNLQINRATALGDPRKLFDVEQNYTQQAEDALPLGIGHLGQFLSDRHGDNQILNQLPILQADQLDALGSAQLNFQSYSLDLQGQAGIASTPAGRGRDIATITEQRRKGAEDLRAQIQGLSTAQADKDRGDLAANEALRTAALHSPGLTDSDAGFQAWTETKEGQAARNSIGLGTSLQGSDARSAVLVNAYYDQQAAAIRSSGAAAVGPQIAKANANFDYLDETQKGQLADLNWQVYTQKQSFDIGTDESKDIVVGFGSMQIAKRTLAATQQAEQEQFIHDNSDAKGNLVTDMQPLLNRQAADTAALIYEQTKQTTVLNMQATASIVGSQLRAAFRPLDAIQQQGTLDIAAAVAAVPPADTPENNNARSRIQQSMQAALTAQIADVVRQRDVQAIETNASTISTNDLIRRDPLDAKLSEINGRTLAALAATPADNEAQKDRIRAQADSETTLANQQYNDSRYIETRQLSTQESVTGLQAQAYGPGARIKLLQAQATGIGEGAETKAEQLLLSDKNDLANADRERRIGINQLGGLQASYLQGFHGEEGSINRTALSSKTTGDPADLLKSIDNEIKMLNTKIGTLVAQ